MSALARNYAEGLLTATVDPAEATAAGDVLAGFDQLLATTPELRQFMSNPLVPGEAKKEAVGELLPAAAPVAARHFLYLLIDKERLRWLPDILVEYRREQAALRGEPVIQVTSAQPLDDRQMGEIADLYKRKYGAATARVSNKVDPALLGGIRVQIGDILADHSLAGRLSGLAAAINQGLVK
ncbi:MAG: ATP synthase F1 subunit delta [Peptococcaceae bacterium]|jgi:F-type H+-transporting ATPase subunit delta|nr:ATP synthase F1 subunit delta [Peptococcaceae bacterium]